jgi:hypothetical protein
MATHAPENKTQITKTKASSEQIDENNMQETGEQSSHQKTQNNPL